jgi:hypothetical protein
MMFYVDVNDCFETVNNIHIHICFFLSTSCIVYYIVVVLSFDNNRANARI